MPPKKTPAPSARKTTVKASIPPLIPKSAAPGHGMSTRPSNKLTHPGLDAMDALRARAQQRPKSVIEAERAVKAAASQARAEAAVTREIAAQELAEYENQITAKAKVSEKEADHPPARRTLPLRATRAVASTRTISSQLVSTPGKNDNPQDHPEVFESPNPSEEYVLPDSIEGAEPESEDELEIDGISDEDVDAPKKRQGRGGETHSKTKGKGHQHVNILRGDGTVRKRTQSVVDEPAAKRSKPTTLGGVISTWNDHKEVGLGLMRSTRSNSPATLPPLSDGDNLESSDDGLGRIQMGRGFADDEGESEMFEGHDLGGKDISKTPP